MVAIKKDQVENKPPERRCSTVPPSSRQNESIEGKQLGHVGERWSSLFTAAAARP